MCIGSGRRLTVVFERWVLTKGHARFGDADRSEEHTSELQSLMRNSYAVFCLKKKKKTIQKKNKRTLKRNKPRRTTYRQIHKENNKRNIKYKQVNSTNMKKHTTRSTRQDSIMKQVHQ